MLFQRQNSKINVYVTMDEEKLAQVVPTCVYDVEFSENPQNSTAPQTIANSYGCSTNAMLGDEHQSVMATNNLPESLGFGINDPRITDVAKQAFIEGAITPLVKEELKCVIQTKRLKEGKEELKVEFTEPPPDQLTPEEEIRVEKRRIQNRQAAQRFRERQKDKVHTLQKKCHQLETAQTHLRYELENVREERDKLRVAYEQHMAQCPFWVVTQNADPVDSSKIT